MADRHTTRGKSENPSFIKHPLAQPKIIPYGSSDIGALFLEPSQRPMSFPSSALFLPTIASAASTEIASSIPTVAASTEMSSSISTATASTGIASSISTATASTEIASSSTPPSATGVIKASFKSLRCSNLQYTHEFHNVRYKFCPKDRSDIKIVCDSCKESLSYDVDYTFCVNCGDTLLVNPEPKSILSQTFPSPQPVAVSSSAKEPQLARLLPLPLPTLTSPFIDEENLDEGLASLLETLGRNHFVDTAVETIKEITGGKAINIVNVPEDVINYCFFAHRLGPDACDYADKLVILARCLKLVFPGVTDTVSAFNKVESIEDLDAVNVIFIDSYYQHFRENIVKYYAQSKSDMPLPNFTLGTVLFVIKKIVVANYLLRLQVNPYYECSGVELLRDYGLLGISYKTMNEDKAASFIYYDKLCKSKLIQAKNEGASFGVLSGYLNLLEPFETLSQEICKDGLRGKCNEERAGPIHWHKNKTLQHINFDIAEARWDFLRNNLGAKEIPEEELSYRTSFCVYRAQCVRTFCRFAHTDGELRDFAPLSEEEKAKFYECKAKTKKYKKGKKIDEALDAIAQPSVTPAFSAKVTRISVTSSSSSLQPEMASSSVAMALSRATTVLEPQPPEPPVEEKTSECEKVSSSVEREEIGSSSEELSQDETGLNITDSFLRNLNLS